MVLAFLLGRRLSTLEQNLFSMTELDIFCNEAFLLLCAIKLPRNWLHHFLKIS
jgi:hypothetical protein